MFLDVAAGCLPPFLPIEFATQASARLHGRGWDNTRKLLQECRWLKTNKKKGSFVR